MTSDLKAKARELEVLVERHAWQTRHGTDAGADTVLKKIREHVDSVAAEARKEALESATKAAVGNCHCWQCGPLADRIMALAGRKGGT